MVLPKDEIIELVKKAIGKKDVNNTVLYLFSDELSAGVATINRSPVEITAPSLLVFIDMKPGANWAHECCYVLVDIEAKDAQVFMASLPPGMENYKLLTKGNGVEDWMVMRNG